MKQINKINSSDLKAIFVGILTSSMLFIFLLLIFKRVRSLFPIPEIEQEKIVSFSHYYGYPIYFDVVYLSLIFILPIIFLTLFIKLTKKEKGE